MKLRRRDFVVGGMAALGVLATDRVLKFFKNESGVSSIKETASSLFSSSLNYHEVLTRLGYGPKEKDRKKFEELGLEKWLEWQLKPNDAEDVICNEILKRMTLRITYPDNVVEEKVLYKGRNVMRKKILYKGRDEDITLDYLEAPLEKMWRLLDYTKQIDNVEKMRPPQEVRVATWIRAVNSQWQLREVMTEFWHNHFNVNAYSDEAIMVTFPLYDRILRSNSLGNFRTMLGEVTRSVAMLTYLNNSSSRASPANENYARELFELHTLGADHYFNHYYNRWREVPGALEGKPIGYIDEDVYEAARAFTGWTIANGGDTGRGEVLPSTGEFHYYNGWHDPYQKRVLAVEFDPNSKPMSDGEKVLDLVAYHPGTAKYISKKICRRLLTDNPPEELIEKAAKTWLEHINSPDQIAHVIRTIVLSKEFSEIRGEKVKRPFEFFASYLRATEAEVTPNDNLFYPIDLTGYYHFSWPTPTGHPDIANYWVNTNTILNSWNLLLTIFADWALVAKADLVKMMPSDTKTSRQMVEFWVNKLLGRSISDKNMEPMLELMSDGHDPGNEIALTSDELNKRLQVLTAIIAMSPEFYMR